MVHPGQERQRGPVITFTQARAAKLGARAALTGLLLLACGAAGLRAADHPLLELPKPRYALGEDVFYWAGVRSDERLTRSSVTACRNTVTAPDGTRATENFPNPLDWMESSFFYQGDKTIPAANVIAGVYTVTVTCGDETVEASFTVERFQPFDDLETRVTFADGCNGNERDRSAIISVRNGSPTHTALVAVPASLIDSIPSLHATTGDGGSCSAVVRNQPGQSAPTMAPFDARNLSLIAHVELSPGREESWAVCLLASLEESCGTQDVDWTSTTASINLKLLFRDSPGNELSLPFNARVEGPARADAAQ